MLPNNRKSLSARRLVLLASVAAVGAAMLVGGPGGYHANLPAWTAWSYRGPAMRAGLSNSHRRFCRS